MLQLLDMPFVFRLERTQCSSDPIVLLLLLQPTNIVGALCFEVLYIVVLGHCIEALDVPSK